MSGLPTDDRGWFELVLSNQPPLWQLMAEACGGGVWADGDLQAALVPASPNRSFFNSVFYGDTERLLDTPAAARARPTTRPGSTPGPSGCRRRMSGRRPACEEAGHVLDATPRAMGFELSGLRVPDPDPELEIREEMDMELLRAINETAYGYPPGDFPPIAPMPGTEAYLASLDGETVGVALALGPRRRRGDHLRRHPARGARPRHRGPAPRPRAGASSASAASRPRTLIATKLGFPVYETLGYRDVGGLEMWERRKQP